MKVSIRKYAFVSGFHHSPQREKVIDMFVASDNIIIEFKRIIIVFT